MLRHMTIPRLRGEGFLESQLRQLSYGSSAKYVIFPNRPSEALFPKNLTGIFHRGGIDQSLINQFPPS